MTIWKLLSAALLCTELNCETEKKVKVGNTYKALVPAGNTCSKLIVKTVQQGVTYVQS